MLSRVADSLYWMSRYLERAQHTARLIDVNLVLMLDQSPRFMNQRWSYLLESLRASLPEPLENARDITNILTFERDFKASIVACIGKARDNASQVREEISSEMWEQLNRLYLHISRAHRRHLELPDACLLSKRDRRGASLRRDHVGDDES